MDIKYNSSDIASVITEIESCLSTLGNEQKNATAATGEVLSNVSGDLNGKLSTLFEDTTASLSNAIAVIDSFMTTLKTVQTSYDDIEKNVMSILDTALSKKTQAPNQPQF